MADDAKDLEKFLSEVDNVESIIKGMVSDSSPDTLKKADEYIEKLDKTKKKTRKYPAQDNTGVNRTVINHAAFKDDPAPSPQIENDMNPEAFMKVLEKDAQERGERRKKQREEATIIKEEGNVAFKAGDYEKAVELYTKALGVVKDLTAVWTNRAQAYIKLGLYDEALSDCDWALRVDEKCLKAFVHRGRAYLAQGRYHDAIAAYTEGVNADPSKEKSMKAYIEEVERTRTAAEQEAAAQNFLEEGKGTATSLVELMKRLNMTEQRALFYGGGFRVVTQALSDDTSRTLFRTEGGLELFNKHAYISKCWSAKPRNVSAEEADMLAAMLDTFTAAITENDENQRRLFTEEGFSAGLLRWAETTQKTISGTRSAVARLIYTVSQTEFGQKLIIENVDLDRLLDVTFKLAKVKDQTAIHITCCLNNLGRHTKFQSHVRSEVEEKLLTPCESLMVDSSCQPAALVFILDTLTNVSSNTNIRLKTASRSSLWKACCTILKIHEKNLRKGSIGEDILQSVLGLIVRLTPDISTQPKVSEAMNESLEQLTNSCVKLLTSGHVELEVRAAGFLSHVLPPGDAAVNYACDAGAVSALVSRIHEGVDPVARKAAVKALSACTQHKPESRQTLLDTPKGLAALVALLKLEDEAVVGNAALCLGHVSAEPGVSARLTKTNIVQHLLVKACDGRKLQLQHNCAILLAKLAQTDQRHLERLRELHGLEILVDVMRHVKT